jgi:hypothetical protein
MESFRSNIDIFSFDGNTLLINFHNFQNVISDWKSNKNLFLSKKRDIVLD